MNVALLGSDPLLVALAQALLERGTHRIQWACHAGPIESELKTVCPNLRSVESWEQLVGTGEVDDVIVAFEASTAGREGNEPDPGKDDIVRRLAQAGKHLLLASPENLALMTLYELAMIREETGAVVMPLRYEPFHPAFVPFDSANASGETGPIHHLVFRRGVPTQPHVESDRILHDFFARDVFLLRHLVEDLGRVNTLRSPKPDALAGFSEHDSNGPREPVSLCVSLANDRGVVATWTAIPIGQNRPAAQLTILRDEGETTWQWEDLKSGMSQRTTNHDSVESTGFGLWDPARDVLERYFHATAKQQPTPELADATRCLELVDAMARSMRRGRAVELQKEAQTESSAFKGTMTSVGCGLLGLVLIALVVTAAAEGLGFPQVYYAWYGIVPLLGLFLGLQLLGLLSRPAEETGRETQR